MSCGLSISNLSITGDCSNTSSGAFSFDFGSSAPGYILTWISPVLAAPSPVTSPYTLNGLSAGSYQFSITDSCSSPGSQTIEYSINISSGTCVSISGVQNTLCGLNNGILTATTQYLYGLGEFYLYDNDDNFVNSGTSLTNYFEFDSLSAGTYYVIANDGGGCTGKSESCIVKSSTTLTCDLYIVGNAGCSGTNSGAIYVTNLNGVPPYTYLWNTTPPQTTSFVTGLTAGAYSVIVEDSTGCQVTKSAIVEVVPPVGLGVIVSTPPSCFDSDGSVTLTITGGTPPYYFSGSNGDSFITFSQTATFNNVSAGFFQIKVTDAGLCNFVTSTSLLTPNGFSIQSIIVNNSLCSNSNGSISITLNSGSPPFVYTLTDSSSTVITSNPTPGLLWNFTGLESDTYLLTISGGSCSYNTYVTVNNTPIITSTYDLTGTTCAGSNGAIKLNVQGGSGTYTYGLTGQLNVTSSFSSNTFSNLASGTYVGTITDTVNACTITENIVIPTSPTVNITPFSINPTSYLNNGSISIFITNGTPPFTWTWSSNVNGQTGLTVNNLSAGTYVITVEDSNGCIRNKKIILTGYVPLSNYQLYNVCDSEFTNSGLLLKKGPKQMLTEGFYDLTSGDTNCILNEAIFTTFVTVGNTTKSESFYTGTTLNDYPSDTEFAEVLESILLSYDGITGVTVNVTENTIKITTPCNTYSGNELKVDLKITYDISCQLLDSIPMEVDFKDSQKE